MRAFRLGLALLVGAPPLWACVTTSKGQKMERDIVALQAQFDELRSEKERLKDTISSAEKHSRQLEELIKETTDVLRRNTADFGVQMEELRQEVQQLRGAVEKLGHDLSAFKDDERVFREEAQMRLGIGPPRPAGPGAGTEPGVGSPAAGGGPAPGAGGAAQPPLPETKDELYAYGYERGQRGELDESCRALMTYAEKFPRDKRADNAIYLCGAARFQQEKYEDVILILQRILKNYPDGDKEDDALLLIAKAFSRLGKKKDAELFLDELLRKHPGSPAAEEGRKMKKGKGT